ncbi:transposase, partial [Aggregatibacter actinomycetemcomitans]|uniref:IS3 family transposase n=1 Tax=Aggregatibacter actinomycetemcomitans TaxID=714 RepID=UPI00197B8159|nr:transposase [Aggregatibacter actinomycetemcomitans]
MRRCFDIHRSTFFRWEQAKPDWSVSTIEAEITRLFLESGETYGSRRRSGALCQIGREIGRNKIRQLMTALQLKPHYPRPTFYHKPVKTFADNWLNQQ